MADIIARGMANRNASSLSDMTNNLKGNFINILHPPAPLVACKGDGITDDSTALQNLIISNGVNNYISLFAPKATYRIQGVVINSNMRIVGAGWDNTVFKLVDGSTQDVFIVANFSTNTGTNWSGGVSNVHLGHFQIDGNKANCPSGGWGLRRFGYRWNVESLKVVNGNGGGIYSEWGLAAGVGTDGEFMEDYWQNIRVHDCNNFGIQWRGPHDTRFNNILVYKITGVGMSIESGGTYSSGGHILNTVHVYSCTGNGIYANASVFGSLIESESNGGQGIILESTANLSNVVTFNNTGDGVVSHSNNVLIDGLHTYSNNGNGFTLGTAGFLVNSNVITGKSYSNTGKALNIGGDNGTNRVVLHVSGSAFVIGTANQTSHYELISSATATYGTTAQRPTVIILPGTRFFDTTLNKPIWRNGANTGWVDATGATV